MLLIRKSFRQLVEREISHTRFDVQKVLDRELLARNRVLIVVLDILNNQTALVDLTALLRHHGVLWSLAGD